MEFIPSISKNRVKHGGFVYVHDYVRADKTYYKCSLRKRSHCKGRGILSDGNFVVSKEHNHAANISAAELCKARQEMKAMAATTTESTAAIQRAVEAGMSPATRAEMPKDSDVRRGIRRYRKQAKGCPAQPADADELVLPEQFKTVQIGDQAPESFLIYDSAEDQAYDGKRMLIFSSKWGLDQLARQDHWAADGTFGVVPPLFQQLYTIHGMVLGQSMPLVYVLMGEKSEAAYTHMLQVVREKVTEEHPGCLFYGTVMTDAERAAINAFQAVFPLKRPQICFFHHSQSVWRKTQNLGLSGQYNEDAEFALKVRTLSAIAFLPEHEVEEGLREVAGSLPDEALPLVDYFQSTYIGRDVAGKTFGFIQMRGTPFELDLLNSHCNSVFWPIFGRYST